LGVTEDYDEVGFVFLEGFDIECAETKLSFFAEPSSVLIEPLVTSGFLGLHL
jgi:hypothetical protein